MPDDADYEWLGWLMEHPEEWTDEDLSTARSLISNQKSGIEDMHSRDVKGRQAAQEVVDGLGGCRPVVPRAPGVAGRISS